MSFLKSYSALAVIISFGIFASAASAAQSVFIISKHAEPSLAQAYRISGDQVTYQGEVNIYAHDQGLGAVGCATWPQKELIFFTYEASGVITWASTKTLQKVGEYYVGSDSLAGIVVDSSRERVYALQRQGDVLYVFSWNDTLQTLVLDGSYTLQNTSNAFGLALDEANSRLYVTDGSATVRYYSTATWAYQGSINIQVGGTSRNAVGIAYSPVPSPGYIYTGGFGPHTYLVKTPVGGGGSAEVNTGSSVTGVAVDAITGLVYCTLTDSTFRVYNSSLVLRDTESNSGISGPAGVAVGGIYKTPDLQITKTQDANDPNQCAYPWNEWDNNLLRYSIAYNANGHADTNVKITDVLPKEIEFDSASGGDSNSYDPNTRVVTWDMGNLGSGSSGTVSLTVQVTEFARPGGFIRNTAWIEGDLYLSRGDSNTPVCCWGSGRIYCDPNATGFDNGTSWLDAYNSLDDALTEAAHCGGGQIWLKQGIYRPKPAAYGYDATFSIPSDTAIYGGFCGTESTPADRVPDPAHPSLLTGDVNDLVQASNVVTISNVDNVTLDGVTVANGVYSGIYINNEIEQNITLIGCTFMNNGSGVKCRLADPDISGCSFQNNVNGVFADEDSWPAISGCSFSNNSAAGIYLSDASAQVTSCDIGPSTSSGIQCDYAWVDIHNSLIHDNSTGVYGNWGTNVFVTQCTLKGNGIAAQVENYADITLGRSLITESSGVGISTGAWSSAGITASIIRDSGSHGISCGTNAFAPILTNNWIVNNGSANAYGVNLDGVGGIALIRNNTICGNASGGVRRAGSTPDPVILNCIFWQNGTDFVGTFNNVTYCRTAHSGTGNITDDPCFVDPNEGDYHIQWESACVDAGQTVYDCYWEPDIDQEDRVFDGDGDGTATVDMGADECYKSPADLDDDDIVNFIDYALFMQRWLWSSCNAGNEWCYGADIDRSTAVNWQDLRLFVKDWLWQSDYPQLPGAPAYLFGEPDAMMMSMPGGDSLEMAEAFFDKSAESLKSSSVAMAAVEPEPVDIEALIDWAWDAWNGDAELQSQFTKTQWKQFIDDLTELCKAEQ